MFIEKDGKKVWDRSKVYGYSDEVMLKGEPEDNQIPIEGCDEELTPEEVKQLFPNQRIIIFVTEYQKYPWTWKRAKVLWIHSNLDYYYKILEDNGFPEECKEERTYSDVVNGAPLCLCF